MTSGGKRAMAPRGGKKKEKNVKQKNSLAAHLRLSQKSTENTMGASITGFVGRSSGLSMVCL